MKILIIYAGHTINENLVYFCRNGYINDPLYDFIFIFNNPDLKLEFSLDRDNVKIFNRENIGLDFAAWTHILFLKDNDKFLYEKYDFFILLNSTVRGPFLPPYYNQKHQGYWPELFISKLNNDIKLVGASVSFYHYKPFISSAFLVMDKVGLNIGIKNGIFDPGNIEKSKMNIVLKKEIKLSSEIINAGYDIKCMLAFYKNIQIKTYKPAEPSICYLNPTRYFGFNVNPYEIVFIKTNRKIDPILIDKYTKWNIDKTNNILKIKYGISEEESIDITNAMNSYIMNKYILSPTTCINKIVKSDPYPNKNKKIFIYIKDGNNIIMKSLNEVNSHLITNFIFV